MASNGRMLTGSSSFAVPISTHSPSRSSNASNVRSVGSTSYRWRTRADTLCSGLAHAASRRIFLRRSGSASREATAVPATLVSRATSSRGISCWSANTMTDSNVRPEIRK